MTSRTFKKAEIKGEIYRLMKEYAKSLSDIERLGLVLAITEVLMAKMSLTELEDWQRKLNHNLKKETQE